MTNIENAGASRAQICELCCEQLAGRALDDLTKCDWYHSWPSSLAHYAIGALKFIGLTVFFSVAMWFFPTTESAHQRKQRLLKEAWDKRQSAMDYWRKVHQDDYMSKRAIHGFHDRELKGKMEEIQHFDAQLRSAYDEGVSRIRKAENSGEITRERALQEEAGLRNECNAERERALSHLENLAKEIEEQERLRYVQQSNLIKDAQLDHLHFLDRGAAAAEESARRFRS